MINWHTKVFVEITEFLKKIKDIIFYFRMSFGIFTKIGENINKEIIFYYFNINIFSY